MRACACWQAHDGDPTQRSRERARVLALLLVTPSKSYDSFSVELGVKSRIDFCFLFPPVNNLLNWKRLYVDCLVSLASKKMSKKRGVPVSFPSVLVVENDLSLINQEIGEKLRHFLSDF